MHDDPPMSEELAARFYPRFEGGWRVAEVVGRTLMLVAVVATLFGLSAAGRCTSGRAPSRPRA